MKHIMLAFGILTILAVGLHADEVLYDCSQDTEVDEELSDVTAGDDAVIEVHADWEDDPVWQIKTLFQFPVEANYEIVLEAVLRLYVVGNNDTDPGPLAIFRAGSAWDEATVTWDERPTENRDIVVTEPAAPMGSLGTPGLWEIDVTEIVQSWQEGFPNNGFYIDVPDNDNWVGVDIATKEYPDAGIHPKLWVNSIYDACEETPAGVTNLDVKPISSHQTVISFALTQPGFVDLKVYDVSGALVETLLNSTVGSGSRQLTWTAGSSGVYFVRLQTSTGSSSRKVVIK